MGETVFHPEERLDGPFGQTGEHVPIGAVNAPLGSVASLLTELLHAQHLLKQFLAELLRPYGLSYPRYEILSLLVHSENGQLDKVVVDHLLKRHHTTTRSLVEGLEGSGFVEWYHNPFDRRRKIIAITASGRRSVLLADQILSEALFDEGVEGGTADLAQDLTENLRILLSALNDRRRE